MQLILRLILQGKFAGIGRYIERLRWRLSKLLRISGLKSNGAVTGKILKTAHIGSCLGKNIQLLRAHSLTDGPVPDLDAAPEPNEEPKKEPTATQTGVFKGATISGGAVTVAGVAEIAKSINEVKDAASSWLNYALPIAIGVALLAIGYIIYDHWQERKNAGH